MLFGVGKGGVIVKAQTYITVTAVECFVLVLWSLAQNDIGYVNIDPVVHVVSDLFTTNSDD